MSNGDSLKLIQVSVAITAFEPLNNMHRDFEAAMLQFVDSLTELNNFLRLSLQHLQLDVSVIVPFPAPPPLVVIPEYVSMDNPHHTLNEMRSHLAIVVQVLKSRRSRLALVPYCYECLKVLNNNIRQYFEGLSINTSDFRNVPAIPPSVSVYSFARAPEDSLVLNNQTIIPVIHRKKRIGIYIIHYAVKHLVFYNEVCVPVLMSNIKRGRELLMVQLEMNDAESGPPSLNPPPTVSDSNTQEGHGSDDFP